MFLCFAQLKCGNCGEVSDKWQYVTLVVRGTKFMGPSCAFSVFIAFLVLQESAPLKGGRGSASMVQKCKLCSRENSIGRYKRVTPHHHII